MLELSLYLITKFAGVEVSMLLVGLGLEVARHIGLNTTRTSS